MHYTLSYSSALTFKIAITTASCSASFIIYTLKHQLYCIFSFKKLAALLEEEIGSHSHSNMDLQSESLLDEEVPNCSKDADVSSIVKDLLYPSIDVLRSKSLRKILYVGERLYQEAKALDEKISPFEANIRRTYFHVKSLDFDQLENWHHYLDFVEVQGDFDWVGF